jgi:NADH:ubiquinone oxidoreductase subunit E
VFCVKNDISKIKKKFTKQNKMTKRNFKLKRLNYTDRQNKALKEIFDKYNFVTPKQVYALSQILSLTTDQVRHWFAFERQKLSAKSYRIIKFNSNTNAQMRQQEQSQEVSFKVNH